MKNISSGKTMIYLGYREEDNASHRGWDLIYFDCVATVDLWHLSMFPEHDSFYSNFDIINDFGIPPVLPDYGIGSFLTKDNAGNDIKYCSISKLHDWFKNIPEESVGNRMNFLRRLVESFIDNGDEDIIAVYFEY